MRSVRGKLLSSKEKKLFVRVVKSDVAFYDAKNFPPFRPLFHASRKTCSHIQMLATHDPPESSSLDGAKLKSIQFYDASSKWHVAAAEMSFESFLYCCGRTLPPEEHIFDIHQQRQLRSLFTSPCRSIILHFALHQSWQTRKNLQHDSVCKWRS